VPPTVEVETIKPTADVEEPPVPAVIVSPVEVETVRPTADVEEPPVPAVIVLPPVEVVEPER
jgi:hypothetical protein